MPTLQITTKVGCKVSCTYCPQEKFISAYKKQSNINLMSMDVFQTCIDKLSPGVAIWFAGMCEPWLNPKCTEMVLYAHNKGHKVCVFTTLSGMTLSDIDILESIPFGFFKVHLPSEMGQENIPITNEYLNLLGRLLKSDINASYHGHGKNLNNEIKILLNNNQMSFEYLSLYQRSGNIKIKSRLNRPRKRGVIGCNRNLKCNVLLPNGDVVLCSNDYGMKNILGNLLSSSYESLFNNDVFLKVTKGLKDDSVDIICRHCDNFSCNVNLTAKILNFSYLLDRYSYYLKDIHSFNDFKIVIKKGLRK